MSTVTLYDGCAYEVLESLIDQGVRVHSVATDPPYFLESIAKRFGKADAAPAKFGDDGAFRRAGQRFTGKTWDAADEHGRRISFDPEFWRLVHDILLPGGYVAAFASPRTGHRQACAMEDAGFTMHPMKGWLYTSGLPKQHPCDKAFKRLGGTAEEIEQWTGWAYGAQAEKPALEPIYVAQRPFDQKNGPANLRVHGVGAINVEAIKHKDEDGKQYYPANVLHDGSEAVLGEIGDASRYFVSFPVDVKTAIVHSKAGRTDRAGSPHPSIKPIGLMRQIVRTYTPPGGTVLDPFGGSGTTAEACKAEGFECLLVERDREYVEAMERRLGICAHRAAYEGISDLL